MSGKEMRQTMVENRHLTAKDTAVFFASLPRPIQPRPNAAL